jgi:hypothetical protein
VNGRRAALLVFGVGVLASQAGHLLAYSLRFGAAATHIQSSGAHEYFPALAKTSLGLVAIALVAGLLVVGFARLLAGRLDRDSAPSYLRLLAGLYTLQLAVFAGQETVEAAVGGAPASSAAVLVLWGTVGQLPVAMVAAAALRWLLSNLRPALSRVRVLARLAPVVQPFTGSVALRPIPLATNVAVAEEHLAFDFSRRGPPL